MQLNAICQRQKLDFIRLPIRHSCMFSMLLFVPFVLLSIANSDAVKRRTLPAWIREGLEKMDREKQKKLEKERMEKERAEMAHEEKDNDAAEEEEGDTIRVPRKSKFVRVCPGPHLIHPVHSAISSMLMKFRPKCSRIPNSVVHFVRVGIACWLTI